MELIRLENVTKTYHVGEVDVPVLKGVSLNIQRGELVGGEFERVALGAPDAALRRFLGHNLDAAHGVEQSRAVEGQLALTIFGDQPLVGRERAVQNS